LPSHTTHFCNPNTPYTPHFHIPHHHSYFPKPPATLNSQHSTFNIQHSTFNTQHSTLNTQHSTLNTQHLTLNTQHDLRGMQNVVQAGTVAAGAEGVYHVSAFGGSVGLPHIITSSLFGQVCSGGFGLAPLQACSGGFVLATVHPILFLRLRLSLNSSKA
jgi:hypothetical protein